MVRGWREAHRAASPRSVREPLLAHHAGVSGAAIVSTTQLIDADGLRSRIEHRLRIDVTEKDAGRTDAQHVSTETRTRLAAIVAS
jgi:hypothetical protein